MSSPRPPYRIPKFSGARARLLAGGLLVVAVVVLGSPLLMVVLPTSALPWDRLGNIGDAYGGVSAVLSGLALCGVGASLIFQQRQVQQELADIDRQQHMELLKLAIDNPELIHVLDADAPGRADARAELYANLTMMYWLAIWELGEIDEQELRGMASAMFGGEMTRAWWRRVGEFWIGSRSRPGRARFLEIISAECAVATATTLVTSESDASRGPDSRRFWAALITASAGLACGVAMMRRGHGRRRRPARMSSMNQRQDSGR